ncbi:MAG: BON domain-containing protein [Sphingomonadales bacterium]|nr:BON domain-containing protein [Sphingomonadales bacterium]
MSSAARWPLEGLRVLDLSIALTGPYAAALMADQGATVVKVERPGIGDIARDRWISAQVRTRILTDGDIKDINYTIDTQNKVVYVLGIAQSQRELDRVLAHARSVAIRLNRR